MAYFATRGLSSQDAAMERLAPTYFGSFWRDHRDTIVQKFNQVHLAFEKGGFTYQCEQDCKAGDYGYVWGVFGIKPFDTIHLCENTLTGKDVEFIAGTIVHEMSHRFAGTDDPEPGGKAECNASDTKKAVNNAECYGQFAMQALRLKEAETRRRK